MTVSRQKLLELLERLGLSEKESLVYLTALEQGETTALNISKASGVKRSTVYTVIDDLKKRGIMAEVFKGFKKKFVAESPRNLQQILEDNREMLEDHMQELLNLYAFPTAKNKLKSVEGAEGIRYALDLMLSDIEVGDYYLVMANFETLHELLPKFLPKFLERRAKYNIKIRSIAQDGPKGNAYKQNQKFYNDTVKIFPKNIKFSANVVLTPHRVILPQLKPYTGALIIENKQVVATMLQLFEIVWASIPDDKPNMV